MKTWIEKTISGIAVSLMLILMAPQQSFAQFGMGNTLAPLTGNDYPIIFTNDAKGGHHQVATIADRDKITTLRRQPGMLCTVMDDGTGTTRTYQLVSADTKADRDNNANWVVFGSGGGTTPSGNSMLYGVTDPSATTGAVGNFYVNTSNNTLFGPKQADNSWPVLQLRGTIAPGGPNQVLVTDVNGSATVWINKADFLSAIDNITLTGAGTIADPFKVKDLGIVTAKIADEAVTEAKLATGSVTGDKILNGAVSSDKIADEAITGAKLATGSVTGDKILNGAVGTAKIADEAVTGAKLATGSVAGDKILNGAVGTDKLADGAINTAKLGEKVVTTLNIADKAVGPEQLKLGGADQVLVTNTAGTEVLWINKADFLSAIDNVTLTGAGTIADPFKVKDLGIVTAKIADEAVTEAKLATGSVTGDKILNGAVSSDKIADGAINTAKLGEKVVATSNIADKAVGAEQIKAGSADQVLVTNTAGTEVLWINKADFLSAIDNVTLTGAGTIADPFKVKDLGIVTAKIVDEAVTEAKLATGSVTGDKILNGAVSSDKIADGAISTAKLGEKVVATSNIADKAVGAEQIKAGSADQVLVTNTAGTEVLWINKADFLSAVDNVTLTGAGTIADPFKVKDLGIVTAKIADEAVTEAKLATGSVTGDKILNGAVSSAKIADEAVTEAKLATGSVTGDKILNGAVSSDKIADGAISTAKLGEKVVVTSNIADKAVGPEQLKLGGADQVLVTNTAGTEVLWINKADFLSAIDNVTISGAGTIADPFKVKDLGIVTAKIADEAVTGAKLATGSVTGDKILNGAVSSDKIADGAINTAKLGEKVVATSNIADKAIGAEQIKAGSADQVLVTNTAGTEVLWISKADFLSAIDNVTISGAGTIADPFKVKDLGIVTAKIADEAVTEAKLATGSVTGDKILNGAVGTDKLADGAINTAKLGEKVVATSNIADKAVGPEQLKLGGADQVLVTNTAGTEVLWINKADFLSAIDNVTISGAGTIADPFKVKDLGIVTDKIADEAVTGAKLATGSVTGDKILNGAITEAKLADGAIITAKLGEKVVTPSKIMGGGVNMVLITDASGNAMWISKEAFAAVVDLETIIGLGTVADPYRVKDNSIITEKLADQAVSTEKIKDLAVTTEKINDKSITTEKLADKAVTVAQIKGGTANQILTTNTEGVVAWADNTGGSGSVGTFNGSRAITGDYYKGVNPGTNDIAKWIEAVFYPSTNPSVSITPTPALGTREVSSAGTSTVSLAWTASRVTGTAELKAITVDGASVFSASPAENGSVNGTVNGTVTNNTAKTFTIVATTTDNKTASASTSVTFQYKRYYGFINGGEDGVPFVPTNQQILALSASSFGTSAAFSASVTPTGSQKLVIAYPAQWGGTKIIVGVNDSTGAFTRTEQSVTNASGGTANYVIFVQKDNTAAGYTVAVQ